MLANRKLVFAGLAAAGLGLAAAGAYAARDGGHWGPRGGGHGWRQGAGGEFGLVGIGGPGFRHVCRGKGAELTDIMMVRLSYRVEPTDAQKPAFEELKTAARTAVEKMQAACPPARAADAKDMPRKRLTPIERLDRTQTQLEAQLEAVKTVRPAAEKFYASLSDDQKAKLSERRGPRWKHDRGGDGTEPTPPAEATPPAPGAQ